MKTKLKKLYEGKAKIIYQKNAKQVHAYYKNDATAFNNLKKGSIKDKGKINNAICSYLFEILNNADIPTHFIKKIDKNTQLLDKVDIVPIEVLVRNYFAGSLSKKFGVKEGTKIPDALKISKLFCVTPIVCSNCADTDLSFVTAVHPSFNIFV